MERGIHSHWFSEFMDYSHTDVMMALAFAGLGMLATGLATLLFRGQTFRRRAALSVLLAGGATGAAFAWNGSEFAKLTSLALSIVGIPYLLVSSQCFSTWVARVAKRPALTACS